MPDFVRLNLDEWFGDSPKVIMRKDGRGYSVTIPQYLAEQMKLRNGSILKMYFKKQSDPEDTEKAQPVPVTS